MTTINFNIDTTSAAHLGDAWNALHALQDYLREHKVYMDFVTYSATDVIEWLDETDIKEKGGETLYFVDDGWRTEDELNDAIENAVWGETERANDFVRENYAEYLDAPDETRDEETTDEEEEETV